MPHFVSVWYLWPAYTIFTVFVTTHHQSLAGQTPQYRTSNIELIADTDYCQLWSTSERICVIPHTTVSLTGFSAAGPRVWNALLSYLWQDVNYKHYQKSLKQHVLTVGDHSTLRLVVFVCVRNLLTLLAIFQVTLLGDWCRDFAILAVMIWKSLLGYAFLFIHWLVRVVTSQCMC